MNQGTVQGSVMGPVLFAIFISPMFDLVKATSFADDTYLSEKDSDLNQLLNKLTASAKTLSQWFKSSGLVVNDSKTKMCIFHKNKKVKRNITISNSFINSTTTIRVILDSNLNWENHIFFVKKSCRKMNMGFRILRNYFNQDELLQLATSMFYLKLYYAAPY